MFRLTVAGIPRGFAEKQVALGEVALNYVEGPQNGLPLLLIPGQMEAWQGYKRVLLALAERFHVFVIDLRGHGGSTRTPGKYSYNICGQDLVRFLQEVVRRQAVVAGLSSGGVLSLWLGANAPAQVLAVVSEDPPIFSSVWPRILQEKYMCRNFQVAVDTLGKPGGPDLEAYFSQMGAPAAGKDTLMLIPPFIVKIVMGLYRWNRRRRPGKPYDAPFLPYYMRAGFQFFTQYDTDFSQATLDGRLSAGFDPQDTLKRISCPVLLLRAGATRHPTWGLLGAIDDDDLAQVKALVKDLTVVQVGGRHDIHMAQPERYVSEVKMFVESLG